MTVGRTSIGCSGGDDSLSNLSFSFVRQLFYVIITPEAASGCSRNCRGPMNRSGVSTSSGAQPLVESFKRIVWLTQHGGQPQLGLGTNSYSRQARTLRHEFHLTPESNFKFLYWPWLLCTLQATLYCRTCLIYRDTLIKSEKTGAAPCTPFMSVFFTFLLHLPSLKMLTRQPPVNLRFNISTRQNYLPLSVTGITPCSYCLERESPLAREPTKRREPPLERNCKLIYVFPISIDEDVRLSFYPTRSRRGRIASVDSPYSPSIGSQYPYQWII
ncbi:hypothetical protein EV426DRAFT_575519 [Tirmania nivea]|nr:hypothetical protein EV426DRAFT_575519 [Tirmania nivea]